VTHTDQADAAYDHIDVTAADGIGRVTMNRPEIMNALAPPMMAEIIAAMADLGADSSVRCVIIAGAGKGFSAGGDLNFLDDLTETRPFDVKDSVYRYFGAGIKAIKLFEKPTIAAVQGAAVGAGCEIALACDFRIAAEDAFFRESWIDLGLISPLGGMVLLPRLVGLGKATEMLMLGKKVDAAEALAIGLVNDVVARYDLEGAATMLAERLAAGPPLGLRAMKEGLRRGGESSLAAEWDNNVNVQSMLIDSDDFAEGVAAMKERRKPDFKGK